VNFPIQPSRFKIRQRWVEQRARGLGKPLRRSAQEHAPHTVRVTFSDRAIFFSCLLAPVARTDRWLAIIAELKDDGKMRKSKKCISSSAWSHRCVLGCCCKCCHGARHTDAGVHDPSWPSWPLPACQGCNSWHLCSGLWSVQDAKTACGPRADDAGPALIQSCITNPNPEDGEAHNGLIAGL